VLSEGPVLVVSDELPPPFVTSFLLQPCIKIKAAREKQVNRFAFINLVFGYNWLMVYRQKSF